ncbi:MAG: hypothetical protein SFU56_12290 [Capsulimonadales bacterium]|nr:hypothetical protein [Capsulimonadales bacterium]
MGTVFVILIAVLAAAFGVLPLFHYFGRTVKPHTTLIPLEPACLPTVQQQQLQSAIESLKKDGFLPEAFLRLVEERAKNIVDFVVLANRVERTMALITLTTAAPAAGKLPTPGDLEVTFRTSFTEGAVVETNNGRHLGFVPALPNEFRNYLPSVRDTHRLHQLHCFAIEEQNLHIKQGKSFFAEGTAAAHLSGILDEYRTGLIDNGYLRHDVRELTHTIRPTLKGAYLTAWSGMFPVNLVRWIIRTIREREFLSGFLRSPWGVALGRL